MPLTSPLNQYIDKITIENHSNLLFKQENYGHHIGDDISLTDPIEHINYGKTYNKEFTTPTPYLYSQPTTIIGGIN